MPKTKPLTQAQKDQLRYERKTAALAGGLAAFKRRQHLTLSQMAEELPVGKNSLAKLLDGEEVMLPPTAFWKLLEVAGLEVKPRITTLD